MRFLSPVSLCVGFHVGAVERAVSYVCEVTGAKQVIWPITLPITGEKQVGVANILRRRSCFCDYYGYEIWFLIRYSNDSSVEK